MNRGRFSCGFTLIELLVGIILAGVLAAMAVPQLMDFILLQRLKGVNATFVTDLQFARSEAAARNQYVYIEFRPDEGPEVPISCYAIYTTSVEDDRCVCDAAGVPACTGSAEIIRTVPVPVDRSVSLRNGEFQGFGFAFDHVTGGIRSTASDDPDLPLALFVVDARIEDGSEAPRILRNTINRSGRVSVCAPNAQTVGAPPC